MTGMLIAGRISRHLDSRMLILADMCLMARSLFQMAGCALQVEQSDLIITGISQGLDPGLKFESTATLAYATPPVELRSEGTALTSLSRN
jgi:MFS transporter, DHA2 family, multidrug resistance protein